MIGAAPGRSHGSVGVGGIPAAWDAEVGVPPADDAGDPEVAPPTVKPPPVVCAVVGVPPVVDVGVPPVADVGVPPVADVGVPPVADVVVVEPDVEVKIAPLDTVLTMGFREALTEETA